MPALRPAAAGGPAHQNARVALTLFADRDTLVDAASTLTLVSPITDELCACPVPRCSRSKQDTPASLTAHLLADHFGLVKAHAAVLARLERACDELGCCPFDRAHTAGERRASTRRTRRAP